jgi:hypothetical protein
MNSRLGYQFEAIRFGVVSSGEELSHFRGAS